MAALPYYLLLGLSLLLSACSRPSLPEGIELIERRSSDQSQLNIAYEKYRLSNGLTVLLYHNSESPLVHVDMTYHVGSSREEVGKSGFAHFFEHMMFQGSKHVGDQQHFKIVNQAGGSLNGSTNKDRTNYYQTVPANQLEKVLWLEADRMGFLLEAVSEHKFEVQRDAVKNERAQRVDNAPYGLMFERVDEALYPREHPYSWQPIGYVEDLDRVGLNDLKAFFQRWYGPNNAVLSIGGDFDAKQALEWVSKYFGPIASGPSIPPLTPLQIDLESERYLVLEDRIHVPVLFFNIPTLWLGHEDEVALDMFAEVLGGGKSSLLYAALVETDIALSASSSHYCQELSCNLSVYVRLNPESGHKLSDVDKIVRSTIKNFATRGVSTDEIQRVRAGLRAATIYSFESVPDAVRQLAFGEVFLGDPLYAERVLERFERVDSSAVMQAYERYIAGKHAVTISIVPKGRRDLAAAEQNYQVAARELPVYAPLENFTPRSINDSFDRSIQPASGSAPRIKIPPLWQVNLANGLHLLATSEHATPTTTLQIRMPGGALAESPENYGIAKFTALMLEQSTQQLRASQLSDRLEALGASISFSAGVSGQLIDITSLSETLPEVLELLRQQLLEPAFLASEFAREKASYLQSIEQQYQQSEWLASIASQRLSFGKGSRLAESSFGTRESIAQLSIEKVKAFWRQHYQPHGAKAVAVSNLSQAELTTLLQPLVEAWQGKAASLPAYQMGELTQPGIYLIDRPGSVQSALRLTRAALPFDATGEYFKANLMNFNFGGNFNSRINQNLREEKGYTYGVHSYFSGFMSAGNFVISTEVRKNATAAAISELLQALQSYAESGPSLEEIDYMRQAVTQQEALSYASAGQKAAFLMQMQIYDLASDFVAQQKHITDNIGQAELHALAKRFFDPKAMAIVVVGDKQVLEPALKLLNLPIFELKI